MDSGIVTIMVTLIIALMIMFTIPCIEYILTRWIEYQERKANLCNMTDHTHTHTLNKE